MRDKMDSLYSHSIETTLLSLFDNIYWSLDVDRSIQLILLDLSSAFDTIKHAVLINQLQSVCISNIPLKWCMNYLTNRTYMYTQWNSIVNDKHQNISSQTKFPRKVGVPQVSILSPILFELYMHFLTNTY